MPAGTVATGDPVFVRAGRRVAAGPSTSWPAPAYHGPALRERASPRGGQVLPDTENADLGGVHDADGEPGNSGGVVGEVPGQVGTVPG